MLKIPTTILLAALAAGLIFSAQLSAHGPTRQKVTETIDIEAPAVQVWEVLKEFPDAAAWLPKVESSSGEGGNEPGATRVLVLNATVKI